jgi:hypothetical protein
MTHRPRRSFIVRVLQTPRTQPSHQSKPGTEVRFWVKDLKTGEDREFGCWEELRVFLEYLLPRQLR